MTGRNFSLRRFLRDEDGAVTVDFVVLTAAIVALALIVISTLTEQIFTETAMTIADDLETAADF
jgi:Flp pilus assembly pilin Flp